MRPEPAQPCYFGPGNELFGLYHSATDSARIAVLMCPPMGQDMIRTHRIHRQLAEALARLGVAVLRFDYYGTGDSAGSGAEVDWNRCLSDTVLAADVLRERSGSMRLIGFGARLGGSIALSAADSARFSELLLWDPVLNGCTRVAKLDAMQDVLRVDPMRFNKPRTPAETAGQWLGFPVSSELRHQLITWHAEQPKIPVQLFHSLPHAATQTQDALFDNTSVITLSSTTNWDELDRLEHAILLPELIRAVCAHVKALT